MSLISSSIPNLVNGVSQQPPAIRLATQAALQVNGTSSVVTGLSKRPPTKHVARISKDSLRSAFVHTINRDSTERYEVVIAAGTLRVFDLTGVERTVSFPAGKAYLSSASPTTDYAAVTVDDYTFITNKTVAVGNGTTLAPSRPYEALVWIKQGGYGITYKITAGNQTATYTGPTSDSTKDANNYLHIDTEYIAGILFQQLATNNPGVSIQQFGSTVYISSANDFYIDVTDGLGDSGMTLVKSKVQRFTDLPAKAVDGFVVEVSPDTTSAGDNTQDAYYVRYTADANAPFGGTWGECAKPGEQVDYDAGTMPYTLVRNGDGTFTFGPATWTPRSAGSLDVIPMPSFVGGAINGVFFHRNRLGFISGENVIFSASGDFFNFFRASAIQLLDSDVIDVSVSNTKVSTLNHVLPFNETLLLFSDQTQFRLNAGDLLTPKTVSVNTTTEYPCSDVAAPVGAGQNVYFGFTRGAFTGIREYYVDATSKTSDANDVTSHVPAYIPGDVRLLAACPDENTLVVLAGDDPTSIWVYNYYWNGQQKMQSAWHQWQFPGGDQILSFAFIESELYIVVARADGTFLESLSLNVGAADAPVLFQMALDRRVSQSTALNQATDGTTTSVTIPYLLPDGETYVFLAWTSPEAGAVVAGRVLPFTVTGSGDGKSTNLTVPGYVTQWFFGRPYEFRYRFSDFQVRDGSGGSSNPAPITSGRLQVRNLMLNHVQAGYYQVEVSPLARDTATTVFTGPALGRFNLAGVQTADGRFRVPVQSKNDQVQIDIVNNTHLPCTFTSAEWEGFFTLRSKRM